MIELSDVIRDLRAQLEQAVAEGAGRAIQFELGEVELEVSLALERSAEGGARVRFWVVELGGDGKRGHTDTQRVRLTLHPRMADTGLPPTVSGQSRRGER
ncbi:trypco2 family protein [Kitasatospora sp. NPDC101157]|uniref:trypco2 family protein n=1 Tax=Kitasatospora sp. NPDC101157 TaxID=3364098 RepID=UPI0037FB0F08